MAATIPAGVAYGYVAGQFVLAYGDTVADTDHLPDPVAATGTVTFSPYAKSFAAGSALVVPREIQCTLDENGNLVDPTARPGVWLIAGRYRVTFKFPDVKLDGFDIEVPATATEEAPLQLATAAPLIPSPLVKFVVNEQIYRDTQTARDQAVAAAASVGYVKRETELRAGAFGGVRYTAYGHSFGQVQNPANTWAGGVYPARLRDALGADPALYRNLTQSGTTIAQIEAQARATWTDGQGGLVTLMGNQNSAGQNASEASFKDSLSAFIRTIRGKTDAPPTLLILKDTTCTATGYARYGASGYNDARVAAFNGYIDDVVAGFPAGWITVADPMAAGWNPATMTAPDGQHPNDRGMALLAQTAVMALTNTYRQGLNVGVTGPVIAQVANLADTFNRADSDTLGKTSSGNGFWVTTSIGGAAGKMAVKNNAAAAPVTSDVVSLLSTTAANGTLQVTMPTRGDVGLVFRANSASAFRMLYAPMGTANYQLAEFTGTYSLTPLTTAKVPQAGDVLKIVMAGASVQIYVNNTLLHTLNDATYTAATRHGIRMIASDQVARLDDFSFIPA
jgi:hypothetical protein